MDKSKVIIYTDGSARGNPDGPGGFGTVVQFTDRFGNLHEREYSAGYEKTTNNRMEVLAAIIGLESLTKPCLVDIYSDSQYLVNAFSEHWIDNWVKKNWKTSNRHDVKNRELWERLLAAMQLHEVTYHWIKGHAGHPENERCDNLATTAADGSNLLSDDGGNLKRNDRTTLK